MKILKLYGAEASFGIKMYPRNLARIIMSRQAHLYRKAILRMHLVHDDETALCSARRASDGNIIFHRVGNTARERDRQHVCPLLPARSLPPSLAVWFEPMIIFPLADRQRYNSSFIKTEMISGSERAFPPQRQDAGANSSNI